MKATFYSNGKLLITGEYVVLDGAKALAIPTKFGQYLTVEPVLESWSLEWISYNSDGTIWFEETLPFSTLIHKERFPESHTIKNTLVEIMHEAYLLNPTFITKSNGFKVTTQLTFPKNWGLGTSSTLINNIAQWANVDPFLLLKNSFGGSGYDIACAKNNTPILYQLLNNIPYIEQVNFNPIFSEQLYFLYLNQKQSSKTAITHYLNKQVKIGQNISAINQLTSQIVQTQNVTDFALLLEKHEVLLSKILEVQTVKEAYFSDFKGIVKSLGAWGGDFVLVVSKENPKSYFESKGFSTLLPFADMVL